MSKKLSDPSITELTEIANNARLYVLLMDEPEGSRDRYINLSVVSSSSNTPASNGGNGNVTSHGSTTVNVLTVYATTDGTKIKSSGIDYNDLVLTADLADYVTDSELTTILSDYVTSVDLDDYITSSELTSALAPYATISLLSGYPTHANLTANMATLPSIFASHANLTANMLVHFAYANGVANIANSVAIGIGASSNAWTNTSLATLPSIYASHANLTANMFSVFDSNVGRVGGLIAHDFRATDMVTATNAKGLTYQFKTNATDGLNDTGSYHSVIHMTPWDDVSGGRSFQLGFTYSGNSWVRSGVIASGWNAWSQIWTSNNFSYNAFATHTNLTSNASELLAYSNSKANISNSVAISIGTSGNGWTNTVAASINSYINASTSGAYSPPTLIANLANLGVSSVNAFIYATSATAWGYANASIYRTLMGAQGDLWYSQSIELNYLGSGDRYAFVDFHSQNSVDYSARIIRNPGANGTLVINNNGYGDIHVIPSNNATFQVASDIYGKYFVSTSGGFVSLSGSYYSDAIAGLNSYYWLRDESASAKAVTWWNRASDSMNLMNWTASTNILSHSTDAIWRIGAYKVYHEGNILDAASALGVDTSVQSINETTSNTYTLVIGDKGKLVASNVTIAAANANVQIPNFGQVAFANGTRIDIARWGNTNTRITAANGVLLNGYYHATLEFSDQYSAGGLHMQKANVWHAYGPLDRISISNIRQVNATNSQALTVRIPSDTQFGDLLLVYEEATNGGSVPNNTAQTNFIPVTSRTYSTSRFSVSMKIADGTEANTIFVGMTADSIKRHIIVLFRGNVPFSNCYIGTLNNVAITDSNPTAQLANVVSPGIVWAAYRSLGAVDPRTFNITSNGEHRASTSEYLKWHTANTATANAIIDMDDEGNGNFLASGTIICL